MKQVQERSKMTIFALQEDPSDNNLVHIPVLQRDRPGGKMTHWEVTVISQT